MDEKYKNLTIQERIDILRRDVPQDIVNQLFNKNSEILVYRDELNFNKSSGIFRVGKKSAKFGRKSKHYKFINLLWENPNKMFDYSEIAYYLWGKADKIDAISKIRQVVYEIKEKLGLSENDQTIFICNEGYMLQK